MVQRLVIAEMATGLCQFVAEQLEKPFEQMERAPRVPLEPVVWEAALKGLDGFAGAEDVTLPSGTVAKLWNGVLWYPAAPLKAGGG